MSKKEAIKITIIEELLAGRFTNYQATGLLDLSVRQIQRMKKEASINGVMSILHRRPKKHRSKDAREREGELVQMDASSFDWLEQLTCNYIIMSNI